MGLIKVTRLLVNKNLRGETDTPTLFALDDDHALSLFISDYNAEGKAMPGVYGQIIGKQTTNRQGDFYTYDDAHPLIGDNFSISETDEYNQEVLRPRTRLTVGLLSLG